jgi:hypothetical protein
MRVGVGRPRTGCTPPDLTPSILASLLDDRVAGLLDDRVGGRLELFMSVTQE